MIEVDTKTWSVHDPDRILEVALGKSHLSSGVEPREDLLFFEHKTKPISVDFGFYGNETTFNGEWAVYVINTSFEEPWSQPLERMASSSFLKAIENVQNTVAKYTQPVIPVRSGPDGPPPDGLFFASLRKGRR